VEFAYRGPHDEEGRIVPVASPVFAGSAGGGTVTFEVPRLGTYQAVVRADAPTRRERTFQFRGILGFSMGGSGSGRIGLGNPDRFDFVAPLGGPTDWTWMLEHIRANHIGGFCTEEERQADPEGCAMGASLARVPEPRFLHEHAQHFEHWWYEDDYEGQGGTFNRSDYISIFRDLAAMFGNPNYDRTADPTQPNITPPGVPDERRMMSPTTRCMLDNQVVIPPFDGDGAFTDADPGTGFFDDEYNPEGQYPVITFCDGRETDDIGQWNPDADQNRPIEVVVAVDIDGNGQRDPGEPVIRNGREPFDDFGLDGLRNEDEVSPDGTPYDPVTNPDPAGDDFHYQYNPTGTENNDRRDTVDGDPCRAGEAGVAEFFLDVGIDGVMGTRQLEATEDLPGGGFDTGEGNGCFDRTRGAQRMIESSPRWLAERMDEETLLDLDVFADGGIRDLFNWVVMGNVTMAGWAGRGLPVRYYNGHTALHMDPTQTDFDYFHAPWDEIGRFAMVRYGDPDAEPRFVEAGDGGHVGTAQQLIDRLRAGLMMMDARWPDGNRDRVTDDRICAENDREECGYANTFVTEFTASTGRTGPVSIVLPPGYFNEAYQDTRYPVVYFLHGYGMSPEDLVALGLLVWADMNTPRVGTERRMQKMILVFPDGRCRNDECLRGTFYTDAPESTPGGAQMQTWLLDLMDHIDATYRTRGPEAFEVVE
jgi:predicted alpha/beta superfamily hydrolase